MLPNRCHILNKFVWNKHKFYLYFSIQITQTPRRETYYPCEGLISRAFNGDYSAFYHNYFMFSKI